MDLKTNRVELDTWQKSFHHIVCLSKRIKVETRLDIFRKACIHWSFFYKCLTTYCTVESSKNTNLSAQEFSQRVWGWSALFLLGVLLGLSIPSRATVFPKACVPLFSRTIADSHPCNGRNLVGTQYEPITILTTPQFADCWPGVTLISYTPFATLDKWSLR